MNKEDTFGYVFLLVILLGVLYLIDILDEMKVEPKIKAGQLIILDNSSYKCKQINTLEEK